MIATNVAPLELRCGSTDAPVPARRTILLSPARQQWRQEQQGVQVVTVPNHPRG
jgi:hypothetical protein